MSRLPIDSVFAVTYHCNSRCEMCDIWKIKNSPELPVAEFLKLPNSLRDINVSGGEPFLRRDLPEIVKAIKITCPKARIVISSNGFATALIEQQMREILKIKPNIGVAISIDGIGEMHNELRGIPGGFDKAMATVKMLKSLGIKNIRLAFTVLEKNVNHLSRVYNLSRELGVEFTHSFAQSSDFYFGGKQNENHPRRELLEKEYRYLIKAELSSWNIKRWLRAYFAYGMFKFITSQQQPLSNAPGRDFFFLDPSGDIYPSVVHNVMLGNIKNIGQRHSEYNEESLSSSQPTEIPRRPPTGGLARDDKNSMIDFKQFWRSQETEEKRRQVDALKIPVWMICTARTAMKHHPFKVGWWIMRHKFLGFSNNDSK